MNQYAPCAADRFDASYVAIPWSGCWIWMNSGVEGYGRLKIAGKSILAHRYSFERFVCALAPVELVCHECDVPACVNPKHLFVGTDKINSDDKVRKGRQARGPMHGDKIRGERHYATRLTEVDVLAIRADTRYQRVIAAEYGVTQTNIASIKLRKSWKHL